MAKVGAKIENPTTGEAITWVETAATTDTGPGRRGDRSSRGGTPLVADR